jgi:phosphoribosylaminoimidazole-succinocarboxamide synthase
MDDERVAAISDRYIELYEQITGKSFQKQDYANILHNIETAIQNFLED